MFIARYCIIFHAILNEIILIPFSYFCTSYIGTQFIFIGNITPYELSKLLSLSQSVSSCFTLLWWVYWGFLTHAIMSSAITVLTFSFKVGFLYFFPSYLLFSFSIPPFITLPGNQESEKTSKLPIKSIHDNFPVYSYSIRTIASLENDQLVVYKRLFPSTYHHALKKTIYN